MFAIIKKLVCCLLVLGPATVACAQYQRPGSTDGEFLKIGVSARAAAMGDAYIAVGGGAEATYYNPSALPWIADGTHVTFSHTGWFAGINHEFLAAARSFGNLGTFGFSLTALYTDEMNVRTPLQPEGTGETFYASNVRAGFSYARWLTDRVTFGANVSLMRMSLFKDFAEQAYAVDIAASYAAGFRDFRFGMKIGNLGSDVQFVNEAYPLPVHFTFGASMNAVEQANHQVRVSAAATKPNDGQPVGQVGAEYAFRDLLFLRSGYQINYDMASYAFGGGLNVDVGGQDLQFDYSYSAFGLLGAAHRFSLGLHLP